MSGLLDAAAQCQGISGELIQQLTGAAGIPFFVGIATHNHSTSLFAQLTGSDTADTDNRRYLLQAALLSGLSQEATP